MKEREDDPEKLSPIGRFLGAWNEKDMRGRFPVIWGYEEQDKFSMYFSRTYIEPSGYKRIRRVDLHYKENGQLDKLILSETKIEGRDMEIRQVRVTLPNGINVWNIQDKRLEILHDYLDKNLIKRIVYSMNRDENIPRITSYLYKEYENLEESIFVPLSGDWPKSKSIRVDRIGSINDEIINSLVELFPYDPGVFGPLLESE